MDLGSPWAMFSAVIIGLVGMVFFQYGRKSPDFRCLGAGIAMFVYPMFVTTLWLMWLIFIAICGTIYAMSKWA